MKNVTNKSDCLQANYRWIRRKYNFDNLIQVRSDDRAPPAGRTQWNLFIFNTRCLIEEPLVYINIYIYIYNLSKLLIYIYTSYIQLPPVSPPGSDVSVRVVL